MNLSQMLVAAPRRRTLVAAAAPPALGVLRPRVWRLWRKKTTMRKHRPPPPPLAAALKASGRLLNARFTLLFFPLSRSKADYAATCHHPHPQTLLFSHLYMSKRAGEKQKRETGGGCGQPESSGECLHTEQRGWVQSKRPRQLTEVTVLRAVVLTL